MKTSDGARLMGGQRLFPALLLCFGVLAAAWAQTSPTPAEIAAAAAASKSATSAAKAPEKIWVVAMARFEESFPSGMRMPSFGILIPRLVLEKLSTLPEHLNTPSATAAAPQTGTALKDRGLFTAGKELAKNLDDRARTSLDPFIDDAKRNTDIGTLDLAIATSKSKLAALKIQKDSTEKTSDTSAPAIVSLKSGWWAGQGQGQLLELGSASPAQSIIANRLDALIAGKVTFADGQLSVTVTAYDTLHLTGVVVYKGKTTLAFPATLVDEVVAALETWIAARPVSRLIVKTDPADSVVVIDGTTQSSSRAKVYFYERKTVDVIARSAGYRSQQTQVAIVPGANQNIELKLQSTTPLAPPGKSGADTITMKSLGVALDPVKDKNYGVSFDRSKDGFYSALGLMAGSIPVTVLALGNFNNYSEAKTRTTDSRIATGYTVSAVALGAGIAITAGLTVNAVLRMIEYLGAAH